MPETETVSELTAFLADAKLRINQELIRTSDEFPVWSEASKISEIARYALFAGGGGKRLRPALALLTARCLGSPAGNVLDAAAAIEMIHTYTLIIDDIQDNDDIRRGEVSTHVKYGINMSLLAASMLLIEGTTQLLETTKMRPDTLRNILYRLHAGQEADLHSSLKDAANDAKRVEFILAGKTGALFELAMICGTRSDPIRNDLSESLASIGRDLGVLFQAVDDLLENTGDPQITGKPVGKDRGGKLTFVSIFPSTDAAWEAIENRQHELRRKIRLTFPDKGSANFLVDFVTLLASRSR